MTHRLFQILVCPDDQSSLTPADDRLLRAINAAIERGELRNRAGRTLQSPLDGALVRDDRTLAYPVIDEIPMMLLDEAIPLAQLDGKD